MSVTHYPGCACCPPRSGSGSGGSGRGSGSGGSGGFVPHLVYDSPCRVVNGVVINPAAVISSILYFTAVGGAPAIGTVALEYSTTDRVWENAPDPGVYYPACGAYIHIRAGCGVGCSNNAWGFYIGVSTPPGPTGQVATSCISFDCNTIVSWNPFLWVGHEGVGFDCFGPSPFLFACLVPGTFQAVITSSPP